MKLERGQIYDNWDIQKMIVNDCSHSGCCDEDVKYWVKTLNVQANENDTRDYLKRMGAWEDSELSSHEDNLLRLFWIACCDIKESGEWYFGE